MSDEEIRRLERAYYRSDPTQENSNALGRARARITPGIDPTEDPAVFTRQGIQLVHVACRALFVGRFPLLESEFFGASNPNWMRPLCPVVVDHAATLWFCEKAMARLLTSEEWAHVALGRMHRCYACDASADKCPGVGGRNFSGGVCCGECDHISFDRRYPWGNSRPYEVNAVWSGYPWRTQRVMTSTGRWILPPGAPAVQVGRLVGIGSNGLPEVIRGDVVGDSFVGIVRAVNEDGTVDIETQRTPELVRTPLPCLVLDPECAATGCDNRDGHQQLVPARPASASWCGVLDLWHVRERVTINGESAVIGGSFLTGTWSAEPQYAGTMGESIERDVFSNDVGFRVCFDVGGRKG